jgi:hypothetical protein
LTERILLDAVELGFLAWLNCTENHPSSVPGIVAWGDTIRGLRESLLPLGWERCNDRNLPLTVNRQTMIAVTASSGDEFTGLEEMTPRTRNSKGPRTKEAVDSNCIQLGLFSDMPVPPKDPKDLEAIDEWATWLLLTYRDLKAGYVRCELSRPVNMGIDGRVDGWAERIILGSIPFDGEDISLTGENGDSGGGANGSAGNGSDAIQVEIRRRA